MQNIVYNQTKQHVPEIRGSRFYVITSYSYSDSSPGHVLKISSIFGMFELKLLWKYLPVEGKLYIIRIVSERLIFEEKMIILTYAL